VRSRAARRRQRTALLAVAAIVAVAAGILGDVTDALRRPELASIDARFRLRGTQAAPREVVLVGIDGTTIKALGKRPPLPRRMHAQAIRRLRAAGAAVIAYDVEFLERTTDADDSALLEALEDAGNVVLAATLFMPDGTPATLGSEQNRRVARVTVGSTNFTERSAAGGVLRRLPFSERGVPSFAVAAVRRAGRPLPSRDRFGGDGAWIDVTGPAGSVPHVPFVDVLEGRLDAARVRGKIVVVGAVEPGLQDVHPTVAGSGVPGPELQADAIQTVLDGAPLRDAPGWLVALGVVLLGVAAPGGAFVLIGRRALLVPAVTGLSYLAAVAVAFGNDTILPVAAPLTALLAGFLATIAVLYATDLRDRRLLRASFARFVGPQVLDEVVDAAGGEARLGGMRLDGTVLFCDLRGFTTLAEALPAEQVIELLNRYLGEVSDAILDHGGTVVSYLGDGVMAVFGAPLPQDDHADRALLAAREILGERRDRFAAWAREQGLVDDARIGVGVASGPVMSGNVGTHRRLEYTAVGDTTNTAARLQAATKDQEVTALISDATRAALRDPAAAPPLRALGELTLRGRSAPVAVWTFAED